MKSASVLGVALRRQGTRFAFVRPMPSRRFPVLAALCASFFICSSASAQQSTDPQPTASQAPDTTQTPPVPTLELDQMVVNLPTTMPLRRHKSYFRITHRFARDLRRGTFGQLAEDLFSLDNGAIIGLEYRFGITDRIQAGINRSILGKTIDIFGRWDALRQQEGRPFGLSAIASIEGQDNLTLDPQPGVSVTLSRVQGTRLALYVTPTFVKDAHTPTLRVGHGDHSHGDEEGEEDPDEIPGEDKNDTAFVGFGMRLRVLETMSIVAEVSPRIYGYRPDRASWNIGVEKLTRGHVMQLNFGNNFGTTPGQVARGGSTHDVYLGFNMSRKF
jgi:hypothetical protein